MLRPASTYNGNKKKKKKSKLSRHNTGIRSKVENDSVHFMLRQQTDLAFCKSEFFPLCIDRYVLKSIQPKSKCNKEADFNMSPCVIQY